MGVGKRMPDRQQTEALVLAYFRAVDGEDLDGLLALLSPDCLFSVETHQVRLSGAAEISGMFRRLWSHHASVRHDQFRFLTDASAGRVAVQFQVTNQLQDGTQVFKSNCNFFTLNGDGLFDSVAVYMAGENTLERA